MREQAGEEKARCTLGDLQCRWGTVEEGERRVLFRNPLDRTVETWRVVGGRGKRQALELQEVAVAQ